MTCASCVASVESIVSNIESIDSVRVNLPLEKATIRWSKGANQDLDAVKTAIRNGGFGSEEYIDPKKYRVGPGDKFLLHMIYPSGIINTEILISPLTHG